MDLTFGSPSLQSAAKIYYETLSGVEKFNEFTLAEEFKKAHNNNDWLLNLLCQYSYREIKFEDALYYKHLKQMVIGESLFMRLIPLNDWAFPDKDIVANKKNLEYSGIKFSTENKKHSDGFFAVEENTELFKVYPTDELTPEVMDVYLLNQAGTVEFGTQDLCKTVMMLMINQPVLRVPYPISGFTKPVAALFHNTLDFMKNINFISNEQN
jgi:hypothetical protein